MSEPSPAIPIGIAVVEHEGRFLVGTRHEDAPLAGRAEFPGGKCEPGESPRDCVVRECLEETGLNVEPVEFLLRRTFEYPHGIVDLHFWLCRAIADHQQLDPVSRFQWVPAPELRALDFPEANNPVLDIISGRFV